MTGIMDIDRFEAKSVDIYPKPGKKSSNRQVKSHPLGAGGSVCKIKC